jgi:hypothetical protein
MLPSLLEEGIAMQQVHRSIAWDEVMTFFRWLLGL